MAYRDELSALRVRVQELEDELAQLRRQPLGPALHDEKNALIGAPTRIRIERSLDYPLDDRAIEDIAERLRDEFGQTGQIDRIGTSTLWSGRGARSVEFRCQVREGKTSIALRERFAPLIGGLFGGIVGGAGMGMFGIVVAIFVKFGVFAVIGALLTWWLACFMFARHLFVSISRKRQRQLTAVIERIASTEYAAAERLLPSPRPALRVESSTVDAAPADAEDEPEPTLDDRAPSRRHREQ